MKILDFDLEGNHFIIEADISLRQKAGPYLLAALLTHGKTLAIGGGDIKLMGACGFVLGVWPGLLHSILSLILAVLTGVMLFGVRRQDFSSIRLPLAPFFCIGGVTAYWLAAAAAVI